jgi:hypothetical protein
MSLIDDIRKALQGEKKSELINQILKEKALYDALKEAGLTIVAEDTHERARQMPYGILSKVMKIDLVDLITEITNIENIEGISYIAWLDRIRTIDLITKLSQLDIVDVINSIKNIDKIQAITEIGKISAFGEVGTLLPFSKTVTSDILTPTAGYKLKILSAFYYCRDDIYTELRFKTSGNLVLSLPTLGSIGMNPLSLAKPLGATDEVLELYMSAGGYAKGWIIYQQIMGTGGGTAHSKTVSEILGLVDGKSTKYTPPTGSWVSPTGHNDPEGEWYYETCAYDADEETRAYDNLESSEGDYLELTISAITCTKIRFLVNCSGADLSGYIVDVYKNGEWVNIAHVDDGFGINKQWFEHEFSSGSVTKARIRAHNAGIDADRINLWEFQFFKIT